MEKSGRGVSCLIFGMSYVWAANYVELQEAVISYFASWFKSNENREFGPTNSIQLGFLLVEKHRKK